MQAQLLALAYAALTLGSAAVSASELLVQTIMLGISHARSADWAHWLGFGVACLPRCAASRATDTAASLVVALLTTLSDLLINASPPLPPPQLEALLVAIQHTHHFCIFGSPPPAELARAPVSPPRSVAEPIVLAQKAMSQAVPIVLLALLHTWTAAGADDEYMLQLAQV